MHNERYDNENMEGVSVNFTNNYRKIECIRKQMST